MVVDRALPAYEFLLGADAVGLLRLPIEAGGGRLVDAHVVHVQYRPGSDVVVRYSAQVSWHGAAPARETLIAASAVHREYPGVVPIVADTHRGRVEVGVWRYPFDPMLPGLADVVSPAGVAGLLDRAPHDLSVQVVAYLPTERAVVRVDRAGEPSAYVKVVAPPGAAAIVARHEALGAAGLPVAPVTRHATDRGVLVLGVLPGPTLRDAVKTNAPVWPAVAAFDELLSRLGAVDLGAGVVGPASRLADGPGHARMLATVAPRFADRLDAVARHFEEAGPSPVDGTVHGDLHEGQVIIADRAIVGLLDIDDVGPGAGVDDWANLIARLTYRSVTTPDLRGRIEPFVADLEHAAGRRHDLGRLHLHVAAALVGLATGPFRLQTDGWLDSVDALLGRAEASLTAAETR